MSFCWLLCNTLTRLLWFWQCLQAWSSGKLSKSRRCSIFTTSSSQLQQTAGASGLHCSWPCRPIRCNCGHGANEFATSAGFLGAKTTKRRKNLFGIGFNHCYPTCQKQQGLGQRLLNAQSMMIWWLDYSARSTYYSTVECFGIACPLPVFSTIQCLDPIFMIVFSKSRPKHYEKHGKQCSYCSSWANYPLPIRHWKSNVLTLRRLDVGAQTIQHTVCSTVTVQ